MLKSSLCLLTAVATTCLTSLATPPTVFLDLARVTGTTDGVIDKYLGIRFAQAPRFQLPVPVLPYFLPIQATAYGPACPQQVLTPNSTFIPTLPPPSSISEDCLFVNVYVPAGTLPSAKLPVAIWIYGGGFEIGTTETWDSTITRIVERSSALNLPMIQVSMNYRASAYGFLASNEVFNEGIGNFGLYDQRAGLQWVNKYIHAFGGDPSKVTLYGASAGAISVSMQVLAFGGLNTNLFRAAFMQSGAPIPVGNLTNGQIYYDALVNNTGCQNALNTLLCLRSVPLDVLSAAVDKTPNIYDYQSLHLAWFPRADGKFLQTSPFAQVRAGKFPNIPMVSGNSDDEGTFFSFSQYNLTTDADFQGYVKNDWFPNASDAELEPIWTNYTSVPSEGSPFDTGNQNVVYPQFKRVAAFQGDLVFQTCRRNFLLHAARNQTTWSYRECLRNSRPVWGGFRISPSTPDLVSKVLKSTPEIGSFHGTEVAVPFLDDYFINFVTNLDPNTGSGTVWPQYTPDSPNILTFTDIDVTVAQDTYRAAAMNALTGLLLKYPF